MVCTQYNNIIFLSQCGIFNHPHDDRCHRCRQLQYSSSENEASSRPKKKKRRGDDDDGKVGGDGDGEQNHDKYKQLRDQFKQRQQREWPPSFETEGASYIFDSRSGMFYHPPSDFFYDPKTKLYYSNKKAQYFHFVGGEDSNAIPFLPVQGGGGGNVAEGFGGGGGGGIESSNSNSFLDKKTPVPYTEVKPKIAISLKTKVTNSPVKSLNEVAAIEKSKLKEQNMATRKDSSILTTDTSSPGVPQLHKKHEKDMDKWSERVKELRNDDATNVSCAESTDASTSRKIKTTASGQPICLLCRRKFASVEKLEQHEKLSALHKENLAKKTAESAETFSKQKEAEAVYRDRSKERRMMHGDLTSSHSYGPASRAEAILAQADGSRTSNTAAMKITEIIRPEDTLGNTNVGNKLLQKLGWKSGDALGRKEDGEEDTKPKGRKDAASNLKSDWERIESLAQGGGHR
ncbi:hypothetical protein ACHAXM_003166 [Skeletonema potamos]|jgi:RNA-binding protein 5/10